MSEVNGPLHIPFMSGIPIALPEAPGGQGVVAKRAATDEEAPPTAVVASPKPEPKVPEPVARRSSDVGGAGGDTPKPSPEEGGTPIQQHAMAFLTKSFEAFAEHCARAFAYASHVGPVYDLVMLINRVRTWLQVQQYRGALLPLFRAGSSSLVRQPAAERRVQQPDVQGILPPAPLIAARYARSRRAASLYAAGPGSRAPMARGRPWALRRMPAWPVPQRIGMRHASGPPAKAAGSGSRAAPMITLSSSYEPARATAGHVPGAAPRQAVLEAAGDARRHRRGDARPG